MTAIFERELKAYLKGATGYVFAGFVLLFAGIYTMAININGGYSQFAYVLQNMTFIFIIAIPILSMRVFAEERKQKTDQLLYSLPVTMAKVVWGKYFAMLCVLLIPVGVMALYPALLSFFGRVYLPAAYGSLLAFFLLGAALIAVGMFLSSLTENQVVAAVFCFLIMLVDYFISDLAGYISSSAFASFIGLLILVIGVSLLVWRLTKNLLLGGVTLLFLEGGVIAVSLFAENGIAGVLPAILSELSLFDRFYVFTEGIFDLTGIVYFLSVILLFVFLTIQSMEKRRWN